MKKIIKKLVSIVATTVFLGTCCVGCGSGSSESKGQLNLICWSEYIPDEVLSDFETEKGIQVNLTTFTTADEMLAKVQSAAEGTYDMIIAPQVNTKILESQGMLDKLDKSKIENIKNVDEMYMGNALDPNNDYSIPYLYTSLVIAVNKDVVTDNITSYKDLLDTKYKDQMVTVEDARAVVTAALKATGHDVNDTSDEALKDAKEYLTKLKPNIHAFNGDSPKTLLLNGECSIGLIYGGECALAMDENPAIVGVYPEEGCYFEMDVMMKTKGAKNPDSVETFINYILDGEVGATIAKAYPYISPNKAAKENLDEEYLSNNVKNPPKEELEKAEQLDDLGDDLTKLVDLWNQFKTE